MSNSRSSSKTPSIKPPAAVAGGNQLTVASDPPATAAGVLIEGVLLELLLLLISVFTNW